jgi:hypothetical protein
MDSFFFIKENKYLQGIIHSFLKARQSKGPLNVSHIDITLSTVSFCFIPAQTFALGRLLLFLSGKSL